MKKKIFFVLAFLGVLATNAQQDASVKPLTIGEVRTVQSQILNEDRILNVYLPEKYDNSKTYPVIYLLDGTITEDFLHLTGLVQFFNMTFQMPDCIVVGIANVDRRRDFTFPTNVDDFRKSYPTTGHSEAFIQFIEEELQPFIEKTYNTNQTKYIIGQSLGGLLATEILLKKPNLFSHYLIVSPSLWWDDESLLKKAKTLLEKEEYAHKYVYLSVGKDEDKIMQREANELKDVLLKSNKKSWTIDYTLMTDDNHATILHRSIYEAFLKLFPYKN